MEERNVIGYEIHTLDNMIGKLIASHIDKDGLTKMQSWFIRYLFEQPDENIFQKDLEAYFHIARSTATGILQLMEKRGFILREPVPSDARLKRLVLTEKAIAHELEVMHTVSVLEQALKKDIPPEKLDVFFDVICMIRHNIDSYR